MVDHPTSPRLLHIGTYLKGGGEEGEEGGKEFKMCSAHLVLTQLARPSKYRRAWTWYLVALPARRPATTPSNRPFDEDIDKFQSILLQIISFEDAFSPPPLLQYFVDSFDLPL